MKGLLFAGGLLTLYLYAQQQRKQTPAPAAVTPAAVNPFQPAPIPLVTPTGRIIPDYYYNPVPGNYAIIPQPSGISSAAATNLRLMGNTRSRGLRPL